MLPKRWFVERTFGWLNRLPTKDVEHRIRAHFAFVQTAMIHTMLSSSIGEGR